MNRLLRIATGALTTLTALGALAAPAVAATSTAPSSTATRAAQSAPSHSAPQIRNTSWGECWHGPDGKCINGPTQIK
ncbi:hypothetical protein ACWCXH_10880 [Kitasatospora sp. NPDC001660]